MKTTCMHGAPLGYKKSHRKHFPKTVPGCAHGDFFGVPPRTEPATLRPFLTSDPSQRAKIFAKNWRRFENFVGLARTNHFPFFVLGLMICSCPHEGRVYKVPSTSVAHITWEKISWRAKLLPHTVRT